MKFKLSPILRKSIFLSLITLPAAQAFSAPCPYYKLIGKWTYSEQGSYKQDLPIFGGKAFSQAGWFKLKRNKTGVGEAYISIDGTPFPGAGTPGMPVQGIPLDITDVFINRATCIGHATFIPLGDTEKSITFVFNKRKKEMEYISTTGDLTVLGTGKKQR